MLALISANCQAVAGLESRGYDPLPSGCALPPIDSSALRLANVFDDGLAVDVCVRAAGQSWARPVLRGSGASGMCVAGLPFAEVTAPFGAPSGAIDVRLVVAGKTCDGPPLVELSGQTLPPGTTATLVRFVDQAGKPALLFAPESPTTKDTKTLLVRLGNFIGGAPPLQLGIVSGDRLPQKLGSALLHGVRFGGFPPAQKPTFGTVDSNGYLGIASNRYLLGVGNDSTSEATFVIDLPNDAARHTLYAVGQVGAPTHPARGLLCTDDTIAADRLHTTCALTDLSLIFDGFNVSLYGGAAPIEELRRPLLLANVPSRPSDVMCLTEVARDADRAAFAAAGVATGFAYAQTVNTDRTTVTADPEDASGHLPPPQTTAACGKSDPATVKDAYDCMIKNCSDGSKLSGGADCLSANCAGPLLPFLGGSLDDQRCFNCMLVEAVTYQPWADNQTFCNTSLQPTLGFAGQSPIMVLSKHKLLEQDSYVFSTTIWRRAALYSRIQYDEAKPPLDYVCVQLPPHQATLPYTGPYSTRTDGQGWYDEQTLAARKFLAWLSKKTGGRKVVVMGDWSSSIASGSGVVETNAPVKALLDGALTLAIPSTYVPTCTTCPAPADVYNGASAPVWEMRAYVAGFAGLNPTQSAQVFFTENIVARSDGTMGPLSEEFGFSVGIAR